MGQGRLIERSLWVQWVLVLVYPRLRAWPVARWSEVLARAKSIEFDTLEQIGTLAGVIVAASIVQPAASFDPGVMAVFVARMILAGLVLVMVLVPFFIRRTRRGLDAVYKDKDSPAPPLSGPKA